jgi:hypothetical protein
MMVATGAKMRQTQFDGDAQPMPAIDHEVDPLRRQQDRLLFDRSLCAHPVSFLEGKLAPWT